MEEVVVRKASDVLIELEHKVDTVLQLLSSLDANVKIILQRQNELSSTSDKAISTEDALVDYQDNSEFIINDESQLKSEVMPVGQRRAARNPLSAESSKDPSSPVPVSQKITDQNAKIVYMADVEILDSNKDLVIKTKSNAAGKWQAGLNPGNYFVSIVKKGGKKPLAIMQEFKVTQSSTTIELETIVLK